MEAAKLSHHHSLESDRASTLSLPSEPMPTMPHKSVAKQWQEKRVQDKRKESFGDSHEESFAVIREAQRRREMEAAKLSHHRSIESDRVTPRISPPREPMPTMPHKSVAKQWQEKRVQDKRKESFGESHEESFADCDAQRRREMEAAKLSHHRSIESDRVTQQFRRLPNPFRRSR